MTEVSSFAIRKTFLLPLGVLLVETLFLLLLCIVQGETRGKIVILTLMLLPVTFLFVESFFRRVEVGTTAIRVRKLFRSCSLDFSEIVDMDTVLVRKRAFLTLSSEDHFIILSNAYADFPQMLQLLMERVGTDAVTETTREMAKAPPVKTSDIVSCWLAVALVSMILYIQFAGPF